MNTATKCCHRRRMHGQVWGQALLEMAMHGHKTASNTTNAINIKNVSTALYITANVSC